MFYVFRQFLGIFNIHGMSDAHILCRGEATMGERKSKWNRKLSFRTSYSCLSHRGRTATVQTPNSQQPNSWHLRHSILIVYWNSNNCLRTSELPTAAHDKHTHEIWDIALQLVCPVGRQWQRHTRQFSWVAWQRQQHHSQIGRAVGTCLIAIQIKRFCHRSIVCANLTCPHSAHLFNLIAQTFDLFSFARIPRMSGNRSGKGVHFELDSRNIVDTRTPPPSVSGLSTIRDGRSIKF